MDGIGVQRGRRDAGACPASVRIDAEKGREGVGGEMLCVGERLSESRL